jgi:C-terminal processing protease CtpA/Prc
VIITGITDAAAVGDAKLGVGDEVTRIDGKLATDALAEASRYIAASNEVTRSRWAANQALRGDVGTKLALTVRTASGESRDVTVARSTLSSGVPRTGPVFRLLENGIGYVDLARLESSDVEPMFTMLEKSPSIIFDMRGYPGEAVWEIVPRLNVRGAKMGAVFYEPFVSPGTLTRTYFEQPFPATEKPLYRGKTVMLVDERTMSQAEHAALFFEAGNGTTFIGSQSAGTNGDITDLSLPGGFAVSFSGHDVRHADGRQLQRVGLMPTIEVKATVEGLRAGKDEVLERAITFLQSGT